MYMDVYRNIFIRIYMNVYNMHVYIYTHIILYVDVDLHVHGTSWRGATRSQIYIGHFPPDNHCNFPFRSVLSVYKTVCHLWGCVYLNV